MFLSFWNRNPGVKWILGYLKGRSIKWTQQLYRYNSFGIWPKEDFHHSLSYVAVRNAYIGYITKRLLSRALKVMPVGTWWLNIMKRMSYIALAAISAAAQLYSIHRNTYTGWLTSLRESADWWIANIISFDLIAGGEHSRSSPRYNWLRRRQLLLE